MTEPREELGSLKRFPKNISFGFFFFFTEARTIEAGKAFEKAFKIFGRGAKIGATTPFIFFSSNKGWVSMSFAATRSANSNVAPSKRRKVLDLGSREDLKWEFYKRSS